jgi:hypothetical protein
MLLKQLQFHYHSNEKIKYYNVILHKFLTKTCDLFCTPNSCHLVPFQCNTISTEVSIAKKALQIHYKTIPKSFRKKSVPFYKRLNMRVGKYRNGLYCF